jgi:hypothetical protein
MQALSTGRAAATVGAALLILLAIAFYGAATRPPGNAPNAAGADRAAPPGPPSPTVAWKVPADVEFPPGFSEEGPNAITFFDDLSWRTFFALNWPAVEGKRGVPDRKKNPGDKSPAVVWETWKAAYELFQPGGAEPSEWDSFEAISPVKAVANADAGRAKQLVSFSNFGSVLEDINEVRGGGIPLGPLVAQNRTYVRYEVHMNQPAYEYIRGNPKDRKSALYRGGNLPPDGAQPLSFRPDSIQVKAAWREFRFPEEKDLLDRYYHVPALLVDRQTGVGEKKTMGLVGLHIVHKTPSRPQWVWSTFEHVDNVAVGPGAPANARPTFQDPNGPKEGAGVNVLPPPITAANPPKACPEPAQVVRFLPIDESTRKTNDLYHRHALVKGTVWENYQLVATQWPTDPKAGGAGAPFPLRNVANVTMETEFPGFSCMGCHRETLRTDFVWVLAVRAHPPTEQAVTAAVKALQENRNK